MNRTDLDFEKSLREKGEKVTPVRLRVLHALSKIHKPVSIQTLARSIKEHDLVTIYRTIETLLACGLVRTILIGSSENLYEINVGRPHHHHIICTNCGHIEPIDICTPTPSPKTLNTKGFSKIIDHTLEFFGICKKCN